MNEVIKSLKIEDHSIELLKSRESEDPENEANEAHLKRYKAVIHLYESIIKAKHKYSLDGSPGFDFEQEIEKYKTEWKLLMMKMETINTNNALLNKNRMIMSAKIIYDLCIQEILNCCVYSAITSEEFVEYLNVETDDTLFKNFPKISQDLKPIEKSETCFKNYKQLSEIDLESGNNHRRMKMIKESVKRFFKFLFPPIMWLREYTRGNIQGDIIAGLTIAIMAVPQAMAYAVLIGIPPQYGLYSMIVPVFLYALFGTGRQVSVGPYAVISLLVTSVISQYADPNKDPALYLSLSTTLCFMVGLVLFVAGILRLGLIVNYISLPVLNAFTTASGLIIASSQLVSLFGTVTPRADDFVHFVFYFFRSIKTIQLNTTLVGLGSCVILIIVDFINSRKFKIAKKYQLYIPGPITIVILGILFSWIFRWDHLGIKIVGEIPVGLPSFILPKFQYFKEMLLQSVVVALVAYVSTISVCKLFSEKYEYPIDANQELIALGLSNIGGAFTQSFATSASLSRTVINEQAGAKSQFSGILTGIILVLVVLFATKLLYFLPYPALAAIVIVSVKGILLFHTMIASFKLKLWDGITWILTFLVTLIFGIIVGILFGILFSIFLLIYLNANPRKMRLGRIPGTHTYRDVVRFPHARIIPKIVVFQIDASLFFANVQYVRFAVEEFLKEENFEKDVIFIHDMSCVTDFDGTACSIYSQTIDFIHKSGCHIMVAELHSKVKDYFKKSGIIEKIHQENFFWSVHDAVGAAKLLLDKKGKLKTNSLLCYVESDTSDTENTPLLINTNEKDNKKEWF